MPGKVLFSDLANQNRRGCCAIAKQYLMGGAVCFEIIRRSKDIKAYVKCMLVINYYHMKLCNHFGLHVSAY